ncbi:MAG: hypothetical protein ACXWPK_11355 [Isosphaeraceae bacterium]
MIESIHLKRFKNFQDVTLELGPLTILIGANAALPRAWFKSRSQLRGG